MRSNRLVGLVLSIVLLAPGWVRAGEKAAPPTIAVQVKSVEDLLKNLKTFLDFAGPKDAANQIEDLFKGKVGAKGLEGVDTKRPLGAFIRFGKELDDITGALMVPIADEATLTTLLTNLGLLGAKDKNGIYTMRTGKQFDVYLRFANKYLYVSAINSDNLLDKNLPDPAKALAAAQTTTLVASVRLDLLPDAARLLATASLDDALQKGIDKNEPGESAVQKEFRITLLRELNRTGGRLLSEGKELRFDLDIDAATKSVKLNFNLDGKADSDLAMLLQKLGQQKSPLAAIPQKDQATNGAAHFLLSDGVHKAFVKVIDETIERSLAGIQNEQKKKQADSLFKSMMPTVKSGEFNGGFAILGATPGSYTLLAAVKLKDGDALGKTLQDLLEDTLKDLPANEKAKVSLGVAEVGGVKVHRFELPKDALDDKFFKDVIGDNTLHLAFRNDALVVAVGKGGLDAVKSTLAAKEAVASPVLRFYFDMARMANSLAQTAAQKDLAKQIFRDPGDGVVQVQIEAGASLNVRVQMRLGVLEYLSKSKGN
jgi:hypothetical protein